MTDKKTIRILKEMIDAILEDEKSLIDETITDQALAIEKAMVAYKSVATYRDKVSKLETENLRLAKENRELTLDIKGLKYCAQCKNRNECYDEDEDFDKIVRCDNFVNEE